MGVFDRIVVGVDGTDFGAEALRQALVLSAAGGSVCAVTALDTSIAVHAGYNLPDVLAQLEEEADRARAEAAGIMGDRPGGTTRIVHGDAKSALRQACEEIDATLLVLGGRDRSRLLGLMAGETATTLLHEATRSLLLARPQWGQSWRPSRILAGIDGSELSLAALAVADGLAERLGSTLRVVTATGGKPVAQDEAWAGRVTDWDQGHPVNALQERSLAADLVVVGSRGLHGLRSLGSVSERVAHRARCSVLVVHLPQQG